MADAARDFVIPEAVAMPKRRWSLSLVWLIPLVAIVAGGWLAVKAIQDRGPTITITFKTAEGLEAGKTKIKYKNVDVGLVKQIGISPDRTRVVVTAELVKQTAPYLVEDTRFWVVSAHIAAGGVSGLGTLFSGAYIGVDIGKSSKLQKQFTGLEVPPVVGADLPGRQFLLRGAELGSLEISSPVYFRRMPVGRVLAHELDRDGTAVLVKIFVDAPYDEYVHPTTRFWNASGIDFIADATGVKIHTQSLVALLLGGIAFETPADSSVVQPADEQHVFELFPDRSQAMKRPDVEVVPFTMYFSESVHGLSVGAAVDYRGVSIGEIKSIGAKFDPATTAVRIPVEVDLYPERLRSLSRETVAEPTPAERKARLDGLVEEGLRGQLRTGSLLTGQLYVALDFFPNAPKAKIDWTKTPPEIPTVPGGLHELQTIVTNIGRKIEKMPLDQIGRDLDQALQSLRSTLHNTEALVKRLDTEVTPEARAALAEARRTLNTAGRTLDSDAPLQQDAREALREVSRAAQAMRVLADYLERHPEAVIRGKKEDKP
jgi:paraquat-inducible protein B